MSSSKIDLKSVNVKKEPTRMGGNKNGIARDDEGKFVSGGGGLKKGKNFGLSRIIPLIVLVSMAGGALVYSSFAATFDSRGRSRTSRTSRSSNATRSRQGQSSTANQSASTSSGKAEIALAERVKSNPNYNSDVGSDVRSVNACAYVQSVYHGVQNSRRSYNKGMALNQAPTGDPNTSMEFFKKAQECGVVLPPSQACEYNRQRWMNEGYGSGLTDAQKMRMVIIGDFCQGKEFGKNDPNKRYTPNYEIPETFKSQYN